MSELNLVLFEPGSTWKAPREFPDLSGVSRIGLDLETRDPNLENKGPGGIRRDGYPVGVSVAVHDQAWYFPTKHLGGGNIDEENVISWTRDLLAREDLEVVFCHAHYDLEWLNFWEISVEGTCHCIGLAEALIDEENPKGYSLEAISQRHLGMGKENSLFKEAAIAYGLNHKNHSDLWQLPAKYVGLYAETDALRTLQTFEKQWRILEQRNLTSIYELERSLLQILLQMRIHGVRVDLEQAHILGEEWKKKEDLMRYHLKHDVGWDLDIWSGKEIEKVCIAKGIPVSRTAKDNASFNKAILKHSDNSFFKALEAVRKLNRLRTTFLQDLIVGNAIHGRIHCQFHQMQRDEGGTRTGRFSSSNPNLQQIPSPQRDREFAPHIRSLFLPDEGELWAKLDYSQQEPRILTHYAYQMQFRGADKVRNSYLENKGADFYTLVAKEAKLERKPAKDLTLGRCYGEGKAKMARDLNVSEHEADRILKIFDEANPFVKELADKCMKVASEKGYIKTILGRHRHFDLWEPADTRAAILKLGGEPIPCRLEDAEVRWKDMRLKRSKTYKALNALIQGSAADMTKAAMLLVFKEMGRIPLMQVHDELNYSVPSQFEAAGIQFRMENAIEAMTVPVLAELDLGRHWK